MGYKALRHNACMQVPPSEPAQRAGVAFTELAITADFGWLFRDQLESDLGVDAHVECVIDGLGTGRLLGLQIKTGPSYLTEKSDDGFVYRPDHKHVDYWLTHSLPILVVLVDLNERRAWWQTVNRETLISTGKHWKMIVPFAQQLVPDWREELERLAYADPYILRLRQYQLAKQWMQLLHDGGQLTLTVEEWVNKSSGRAALKLIAQNQDGDDLGDRSWPYLIFPFADYAEELPRLFPWADLQVDEDHYHDYDFAQYELDCGIWDSEDGRYFYGESFDEWRRAQTWHKLRPYEEDGEVAHWRLQLTLNDVGRAFLTLDQQLTEGLLPLA
ncbi:DUF4365 domain-containing protein [Actinoplanes subtropicus]|uniref:DUF4365 domain-containing protein n=1 Tax=Actinoplanes subtropicus TaxID=543632 RepID=UPI000A01F7DC|nr:DUF4365 domain-containing protein [Actinoplanes subtropicus]